MSQFFKYVLATMLGLFLFTLLATLFLAGVGSAVSASSSKSEIQSNSVLKLDLNQNIVESYATEEDPFSSMLYNETGETVGLVQLKEAIKNAKTNNSISGIYLESEYPSASYATLKEIRDALIDFKKSKKFVYSYGESASEKAIYVNSVADKIYINPAGSVEFDGLEGQVMFMKKMLDKLGIKPEIFKVGTYKSAVEPLVRTNMSDANKEQVSSYLNSISNHIYNEISASRNIPRASIDEALNSLKIQNNGDAIKVGLITNEGYFDEFENAIRQKIGLEADKKINFIGEKEFLNTAEKPSQGYSDSKIAVIISQGDIHSGKSEDGQSIGSTTFIKELRRAKENKRVKAIVLRINSGGGSALASDAMWREIQLAKKVKPVIASMGDVAASGGYYMAMGADQIVASPMTITGSIGIFGVLFNAQDFLNNKLGITFDKVRTNPYADFPSLTHEMSEFEKSVIQKNVNEGYKKFTTKAAEGRNMPLANLEAIASGRVWTGSQAKENGLVDVLGNLEYAIELAAQKAGIKNNEFSVQYYPRPRTTMDYFLAQMNGSDSRIKFIEELGIFSPAIREYEYLKDMETIQARMPYLINIK